MRVVLLKSGVEEGFVPADPAADCESEDVVAEHRLWDAV